MGSTLIRLTGLPVELNQVVFVQVDDKAICALRLTSKSLQNATIYRFRKAFAYRTTDLSTKSLQALVVVCDHQHLGPAIQSLTIPATYYDTAFLQKVIDTKRPYKVYNDEVGPVILERHDPCSEVELAETAVNVGLLEQRKIDQANHALSQSDLMLLTTVLRKASKLRTLTLEVGLYRYPGSRLPAFKAHDAWPGVWKRAIHVYLITMTAMGQSESCIAGFHIYGGRWGCGVLGYDVYESMSYLKARGVEAALASLRILSLNCTTRLIEAVRPLCNQEVSTYPSRLRESDRRLVSLAPDNSNYMGPAHLLALCPNLEELELVHYCLRTPTWCSLGDISTYCRGYDKVLDQIAQVVRLPRLLKCTIRGYAFSQCAVLHFLKNSPLLKHLDLRFMNLTGPGTWGSIFEQCRNLDTLILRRLIQNGQAVVISGKPEIDEAYNLNANKDQLQRGLEYEVLQYERNSPWVEHHRQEMRREHGLPKWDYGHAARFSM